MKNILIISCSGMFRDVPECSGMFRNVPECSGMFRNVPGCSMFRVLATPRKNKAIKMFQEPSLCGF